MNYVCV